MYTNIPHNKLTNVMRELINSCFKVGEKWFIVVTKFGATWTGDKNKYKKAFDKASLELDINFSLDNCFSNLGYLSLWQIIGISMESDLALFMESISILLWE